MSDTEYWQLKQGVTINKYLNLDGSFYFQIENEHGNTLLLLREDKADRWVEPVSIETKRQQIRDHVTVLRAMIEAFYSGKGRSVDIDKHEKLLVDAVLDIVGYKGETK